MPISDKAVIGSNCRVAATAVIYDNVELGANCVIEDFCVLGDAPGKPGGAARLEIGAGSIVRSHSRMYGGSTFGADLRVGHHALVREGVSAGRNLQIGSFNAIEGDSTIGDYVRFHSTVNLGRGTTVGDLVWIFPNVVVTNNPLPPSHLVASSIIEDAAVIATAAILMPGITVGRGAYVAACTRVTKSVPRAAVVSREDNRIDGPLDILRHFPTQTRHPWMSHFSDFYPAEAQARIAELHALIKADIAALKASRARPKPAT